MNKQICACCSIAALAVLLYAGRVAGQQHLCMEKEPHTAHGILYDTAAAERLLHTAAHRVVLLGEMHNGSFTPEIKLQLIKHLCSVSGIRHFFMETGPGDAWHYNQFLQTGDTFYLTNPPALLGYGAYRHFWQRLYAYNATLPDSSKIVIHGVDFDRTQVFTTLTQLLPPGAVVPAVLQPVFDTIRAHQHNTRLQMFDGTRHEEFNAPLRYIKAAFLEHLPEVQQLYGQGYATVHAIITNRNKTVVKPGPRNKTMSATIAAVVQQEHITRFAGFFGGAHVERSTAHSLARAMGRLPSYQPADVLSIIEVLYNQLNEDGTPIQLHFPHMAEIIALNGSCKAILVPAAGVPGFEQQADWVLIADQAQ